MRKELKRSLKFRYRFKLRFGLKLRKRIPFAIYATDRFLSFLSLSSLLLFFFLVFKQNSEEALAKQQNLSMFSFSI